MTGNATAPSNKILLPIKATNTIPLEYRSTDYMNHAGLGLKNLFLQRLCWWGFEKSECRGVEPVQVEGCWWVIPVLIGSR
jgi:hypothetical protein